MIEVHTQSDDCSILEAWCAFQWEMTPGDGSVVLDLWDAVGEDIRWSIFNGVQRRSDDWDFEFGDGSDENPWVDLVIALQERLEDLGLLEEFDI